MAKKKSRSSKSGEPVKPDAGSLDSDKPGSEEPGTGELVTEEVEATLLKAEEADGEEHGDEQPITTESETETPDPEDAEPFKSETEETHTRDTNGAELGAEEPEVEELNTKEPTTSRSKTGGFDIGETDSVAPVAEQSDTEEPDKRKDDASDDQEATPGASETNEPIHVRRRRRKNLSKRTRRLLFVAVGLWIGALALLGVRQLATDFDKPLGAPLGTFGASGPSRSGTDLAGSDAASTGNVDPLTGQPVTSDGRSPQCGGPAEMTIMLVGVDTGYDPSVRGLADTIRVVHLDFVRPGISVLSVPRALWVEAPMLADHAAEMRRYFGIARDPDGNLLDESGPYGMLNSTYFYGNKHQVPGGGPTVLAEALYVNLGVPVDHYAAISMTTIADAIDAIGGVDVVVPYAITGWDAGLQHMSGPQVVTFARQRQDDSDWYRVERQNVVLKALWDKMTQPRNLVKVPNLTDRFINQMLTDLSKAQILSMACLMTQVSPDEVEYYPITPNMVTVSDTTIGFFILLPDREAIDPLVREFFTGS